MDDDHLYKIAADAQSLDKRPLLDRLREATKHSHYSLYAEAYCALKPRAIGDAELPTDPQELLKLADTHGWLYDDHSMGRALTNALRALVAEKEKAERRLANNGRAC